ncbi:MAG: hypothetical protein E7317_08000 [Clostridiales bacterium]|nr:hypothetical protein [Clostridiales bacterium]
MSSILSLIMCFALLFTGGENSQDPAAVAARTLTVSDITIYVGEEEYALDPSLTLGIQTEGDTALVDLGVQLGDETLFPCQAGISEDGVKLLPAHSDKVYTITADAVSGLIGEEGIAESEPMIKAYIDLVNAMVKMVHKDDEKQAMVNAYMAERLGDVQGEETEFTIDDGEGPRTEKGQKWAVTLDNAQLCDIVDYVYNEVYPEFGSAYFAFLNAALAMDRETEAGEIKSFGDVLSLTDMEMGLAIDAVSNETCGIFDFTMTVTAEGETFEVPFTVNVYGPDHSDVHLSFSLEDTLDMNIDGETVDGVTAIDYSVTGDGLLFDVSLVTDMLTNIQANGTVDAGGFTFTFDESVEALDTEAPRGTCSLFLTGKKPIGLSYSFELAANGVEDRIEGVEEVLIDDMATIAESGLPAAFMAMAADIAKLQQDPGIADAIAAVTAFAENDLAPAEDGFDFEGAEEEDPGSPEDLSFAMPAFSGLPEGYQLQQGYYYGDYDIAYQIYAPNGDPEATEDLLYVNTTLDSETNYKLDFEGGHVEEAGSVISVDRLEDYITAEATLEGLNINLMADGDWLTDEQIAAFFSSIDFAPAAAD